RQPLTALAPHAFPEVQHWTRREQSASTTRRHATVPDCIVPVHEGAASPDGAGEPGELPPAVASAPASGDVLEEPPVGSGVLEEHASTSAARHDVKEVILIVIERTPPKGAHEGARAVLVAPP